jgi:hypothetical protein
VTSPDRPDPPRSLWRRILRAPIAVLVALYFVLDDVVLAAIRPVVGWLAGLRLFARIGAFIQGLAPYPTLFLFAVPFAILEPPKLIAVYLMATGRFRTGLILLVVSHLLSIVLVERLFHVTRDKLLMIPWFARGYGLVIRLRDWALGILRATAAWRIASAWTAALRAAARRLRETIRPLALRVRDEARRVVGRVRAWIRRVAQG